MSLSGRVRWGYAAAALPLAVVQIPLYVFIPKFYTDVVGLPIGAVGLVLLGGRALDAITDPTLGWLSDRTRTSLGRRRPWLLGASLPLALCIYLLFVPPAWIGVGSFALLLAVTFVAWTAVFVPYQALGVELTQDYDERTTLLGLRDGLTLIGILLAVVGPVAAGAIIGATEGPEGEALRMAAFASVAAPAIVVGCWITAWSVRELPVPRNTGRPQWRSLWDNRPFMILLAAWVTGGLGTNLTGAVLLYFVERVVAAPRPEWFLLLYIVVGILCTPVWLYWAKRSEKRTVYLWALGIAGTAQCVAFLTQPGQLWLYGILTAISGTTFGALVALPNAMQGDVIDHGAARTGQRDEGLYLGVLSVCRKMLGAAGVGGALALLGAFGYDGEASAQPDSAIMAIRLLYTVVPGVLTFAAMALLWSYPIDRETHRRTLRRLGGDARLRGETLDDADDQGPS